VRTTGCLLAALALQLAVIPAALAADAPAKKPRIKVAVLDVKSAGTIDPKTFEGVSSLIATELGSKRPDLQVVGAAEIRAMIGFEKEKQLLGCSEGACLAEIGGALGVEFLVATEGLKLGGTWVINMSLIDVTHSKALTRTSKKTKDDGKLVDICLEAVRDVASGLPAAEVEAKASPAEQKPAEQKPAEPVAAPPAATASTEVQTSHPYSTPGWALLGAGAAVAIAGGVCYGVSWSQYSGYKSDYDAGSPHSNADLDSGKTLSMVGVVGMAAGGAVLATGVVLLLIPGKDAPRVSIAPTPGGAYASVGFDVP
jgi:hypothetical protein